MSDKRYPTPDLWEWAMNVAKQVHPLYVANDWVWFVEYSYGDDWASKEVPSVPRIASNLCQKAHHLLDDPDTSSVSGGRLTVSRAEGDEEQPGTFFVVSIDLEPDYKLASTSTGAVSGGDGSDPSASAQEETAPDSALYPTTDDALLAQFIAQRLADKGYAIGVPDYTPVKTGHVTSGTLELALVAAEAVREAGWAPVSAGGAE